MVLSNIKLRLVDRRQRWRELRLRHKLLVIFIALLIVGGAVATAKFLLSDKPEGDISLTRHEKKKTTVPSPLTGVEVEPALAKRPVTGIMIENSLDARPQSGLRQAGIVFEAVAEGGITRFIALYQEAQPQYVGPVRSLRPYYIDWASAFDASIAHVGGSPDALKQIRSSGKDLDQFFNPGTYWRVSSRPPPHNVYTSFKKLDALNKAKGFKKSKFTSWPRKADNKNATANAVKIDLAISSANFNVHYDYDRATNSYIRYLGGRKHVSTRSEHDAHPKAIQPKVVLALVIDFRIASDGKHGIYDVNGGGPLYVFQDGRVKQGTWSKDSRSSQLVFSDAQGNPIKLNAGQTWVSMVTSKGAVSYKAPSKTESTNPAP